MKRKVIKQGHNTLTITLPAKWVEKNEIKAGDEINLEEKDKSIVLSAKVEQSKKTLNLKLPTDDFQFTRLLLNNIYRRGIDSLRIEFHNDKQFENIQSISDSNFMGFEVIRKEKGSCVLENITEPKDIDISTLMRRIMLIIKETLSFIEEDLGRDNRPSLHYIRQQSKKIEQFDNFCKRLISKGALSDTGDSYFCWIFLYYLMLIGRAFLHMYEYVDQKDKFKISKKTIAFIGEVKKNFDLFYASYHQKDFEALSQFNNSIKKLLYDDLSVHLAKTTNGESVVVHWIMEITRLMTLLISPSLEICFSRDIQRD